MLKRNSNVKLAPQRWQENAADGSFDIVFTFEEKVFDMVIEGWFSLHLVSLFLSLSLTVLMYLKLSNFLDRILLASNYKLSSILHYIMDRTK